MEEVIRGGQSEEYQPRNEAQLQSFCFLWMWNTYPAERGLMFHVDNNSVNGVVGAQKKALGVVKGVVDMIWYSSIGVVSIEFKFGGGQLSEKQVAFRMRLRKRGYMHVVIKEVNQFKEVIWQVMKM